jgi:hypothetical protein
MQLYATAVPMAASVPEVRRIVLGAQLLDAAHEEKAWCLFWHQVCKPVASVDPVELELCVPET